MFRSVRDIFTIMRNNHVETANSEDIQDIAATEARNASEIINEFFDLFSSKELQEHLQESFLSWLESERPEQTSGRHRSELAFAHQKLIEFLIKIENQ